MYYVVRSDRSLSFGQTMALGGAGAVACTDRFRETERWAASFALRQAGACGGFAADLGLRCGGFAADRPPNSREHGQTASR